MQRIELINKIMDAYKNNGDYDEKLKYPPPRISEIKDILKDLDKFTSVKVYAGPNVIKIDDLNKNEPADDKVVDEKLHFEIFANPLKFIYAGTETFKISISTNTLHDFLGLFGSSPFWTSNVFFVLKQNNITPPEWFSAKYDYENYHNNKTDNTDKNDNNDNTDKNMEDDDEDEEGGITYM